MRWFRWTWLAVGLSLLMGAGWLGHVVKVAAQSPDALASLTIALWPEYDRPEVLVIYQGALKIETSLPATVHFELPSHVQQMHAVAYLDEDTGRLINLDSFRLETTAQGKRLTLTTPARRFHAEYYATDLLTREGPTRTIHYVFTATTTIENFRFEVQQPLGVRDFVSEPMPVSIEQRADHLFYARYPAEALEVGASRSLRVSYRRSSDEMSVEAMRSVAEGRTGPPVPGAVVADTGWPFAWGIALVGAFCLGAGLGYFLHGRLVRRDAPVGRRAESPGRASTARYCYRCGTPLYPEAMYCHLCGAPRRV